MHTCTYPSTGDEYDYVILTTVRSQPLNEISNPDLVQPDRKWLRYTLGFVTDPHQVNVAITRAKQGLIIVGECFLISITFCACVGTNNVC